jgi:hypothetical protein
MDYGDAPAGLETGRNGGISDMVDGFVRGVCCPRKGGTNGKDLMVGQSCREPDDGVGGQQATHGFDDAVT